MNGVQNNFAADAQKRLTLSSDNTTLCPATFNRWKHKMCEHGLGNAACRSASPSTRRERLPTVGASVPGLHKDPASSSTASSKIVKSRGHSMAGHSRMPRTAMRST